MRYEWHGFVIIEGDLTEDEARREVDSMLYAINRSDSIRVFLDDGSPEVEDDE